MSQSCFDKLISKLTPDESDKHRSVFLHFLQSLIGVEIDVQLADGKTYRGIFCTATPFPNLKVQVVVKCSRLMNGDSSNDSSPGATLIVDMSAIKHISVAKLDLTRSTSGGDNGQLNDMQTDTAISNKEMLAKLDGRQLKSIDSAWLDSSTSGSTNFDYNAKKSANWDQFDTNKKLFNVNSSYDENLYTKKLDKSTLTKEQIHFAEKMAREIEGTASTNIHMQEERGQASEYDHMDEEDRFSGVIRAPGGGSKESSPNKAKQNNNKNKSGPAAVSYAGVVNSAMPAADGGTWRRTPIPTPPVPPGLSNTPSHADTTSPPPGLSPPTSKQATPPPPGFVPASGSPAIPTPAPAAVVPAAGNKQNKPPKSKTPTHAVTAPEPAVSPAVSGTPPPGIPAPATATTPVAVQAEVSVPAAPTATPTIPAKLDTTSTSSTPAPANQPDSTTSTGTPAPTTPSAAAGSTVKKGLNPTAKEFKFSVTAAEYVPSFASPANPNRPNPNMYGNPNPPVYGVPMGNYAPPYYPQQLPYGPHPGMGQMDPMMYNGIPVNDEHGRIQHMQAVQMNMGGGYPMPGMTPQQLTPMNIPVPGVPHAEDGKTSENPHPAAGKSTGNSKTGTPALDPVRSPAISTEPNPAGDNYLPPNGNLNPNMHAVLPPQPFYGGNMQPVYGMPGQPIPVMYPMAPDGSMVPMYAQGLPNPIHGAHIPAPPSEAALQSYEDVAQTPTAFPNNYIQGAPQGYMPQGGMGYMPRPMAPHGPHGGYNGMEQEGYPGQGGYGYPPPQHQQQQGYRQQGGGYNRPYNAQPQHPPRHAMQQAPNYNNPNYNNYNNNHSNHEDHANPNNPNNPNPKHHHKKDKSNNNDYENDFKNKKLISVGGQPGGNRNAGTKHFLNPTGAGNNAPDGEEDGGHDSHGMDRSPRNKPSGLVPIPLDAYVDNGDNSNQPDTPSSQQKRNNSNKFKKTPPV